MYATAQVLHVTRSHIDKIVGCGLVYILGGLFFYYHMVLENNEPHKVYVQVYTLDSWVCGPEPTGVLCPYEWATVRLCDKLSWPNITKLVCEK